MGTVIFDISMSLDGFIAASGMTPDLGMGDGGEALHDWAFAGSERDRELLEQAGAGLGAVIAGRRTYDNSIKWWDADGPTGPARVPVFVVSHGTPGDVPEDGVYTFVGDIRSALDAARTRAGGKDVGIMGGADIARQYLHDGLVDEISIHLVPGSSAAAHRCSAMPGSTSTCDSRAQRWSPRMPQRTFDTGS